MMRTLLLAGLGAAIGLAGGCRTAPVRTVILAEVSSEVALDCIVLTATGPAGDTLSETLLRPTLTATFRSTTLEFAVYPGDVLHDTITLQAVGHRSGKAECDGPPLGESLLVEATFVQGEQVRASLSLTTLFPDADADGWEVGVDCDDGDPLTFPGAPEICDDTLDQGCVGTPDLGCPCDPDGRSRSCYPRGLDSRQVTLSGSVCRNGVQRCEGGGWGLCEGAVTPAAEICDGIDTDCDGTLDPEGCPCVDNQTRTCFTFSPPEAGGVGTCKMGISTCLGGTWGSCFGDVGPAPEICNGQDDDCDGAIDDPDEIPREFCERTEGVCGLARKACASSGSLPCTDAEYTQASSGAYEQVETLCDGLDNDCNGQIDETCACDPTTEPTRPCFPFGLGLDDPALGLGPCTGGTQTCLSSTNLWGACVGATLPVVEACDGTDLDCNGVIDDVVWAGQPCVAAAIGLCAQGTLACDPTVAPDGRSCLPAAPVEPDPACDGLDADCDSADDPANDDRDATCSPGLLCCGGACLDTQTDLANCGDCFAACPDNTGECQTPVCVNGGCTTENRSEGFACSDDGTTCTLDACAAGLCMHPAVADGTGCTDSNGTICVGGSCLRSCFIGGTVYDAGAQNPANPCQACGPGADPFGWSNRGPSTSCADDGNVCTTDRCGGGSCRHPPIGDGSSCGSAQVCVGPACRAGCYIGGNFYDPDVLDPNNDCRSCQPGTSSSGWTPLGSTIRCASDGDLCTVNDHCDGAGACVGGGPKDCSALNDACNLGACNPGTGSCEVRARPAGRSCSLSGPSPGVCDGAGSCFDGCYISNTLEATGSRPFSNLCRICDPASNRTAWTNEPNTTPCSDGINCTVGDTCNGSGACRSGPLRDCTAFSDDCNIGTCNETSSLCEAIPRQGGWSCPGGKICDGAGACALGCFIATTFYPAGADNPANVCESCDPAIAQGAWTIETGTVCTGDGNACTIDQCQAGTCTHSPNDGASCGTGCICTGSTATEFDCANNVDDDADGLTDCSDVTDCDGLACNGGICNTSGQCI